VGQNGSLSIPQNVSKSANWRSMKKLTIFLGENHGFDKR